MSCTGSISGQIDSVMLDSIFVLDRTLNSPSFFRWSSSDTEGSTLDRLIKTNSSIYVREYGISNLSTLSIRGSNSGQTRILWNGVSIDNPLTGSTDLSNMKLLDFDRTEVMLTNEDAVGAIGGTLALDDYYGSIKRNEGSVTYSYGSWHTARLDAGLSIHQSKYRSKSSFLYDQTQNNYSYLLTNGEERLQTNASQQNFGVKHSSFWIASDNLTTAIHYWFGHNNRKIPPKTTQTTSNAFKIDKFHRLLATLDYGPEQNHFKTTAGLLYDENHFVDSLQSINATNTSQQLLITEEFSSELNSNHKVYASGEFRHTEVISSGGINSGKSISDIILEAKWQWHNNRNQFKVGFGNQYRNGFSPLLINANWTYRLVDDLEMHISLAKNFRRPSLNDLFWIPGGNPDLLPENAYQSDLRFDYKGFRLATYYKIIENWILWKPSQESFLFSARNISEVKSFGTDLSFQKNWTFSSKIKSTWSANLGLNSTYSLRDIPEIGIVAGEQLIYSPKAKATVGAVFDFEDFTMGYNHLYTSSVKTELEPSKAFQIGYLTMAYRRILHQKLITMSVRIDNLWDTDYRVVPREAMPGRTITISGQIKL